MRRWYAACLGAGLGLTGWVGAQSPWREAASYWGGGGDDAILDAAVAREGGWWVVGVTSESMRGAVGAAARAVPAPADAEAWYGYAFVARLTEDGQRFLAYLEAPRGVARFTSVAETEHGLYIGGYGLAGMREWVASAPGFRKAPDPESPRFATHTPRPHYTEPMFRPGSDARGAPLVLRLTPGLDRLLGATWLEGWESVWHIPRPLGEDERQNTLLCPLPDGRMVVVHDGGYNLRPPEGQRAGPEEFYLQQDHISLLRADLTERIWRRDLRTPEVTEAGARRALGRPWPHGWMGNPRTFRVRPGPDGDFFVCGWSASHTSKEPWWSSFLRRYRSTGEVVWSAYEHDPTGGPDGRMAHLVSDSAVASVVWDGGDRVVALVKGDGGNSILRRDPGDYLQDAGDAWRGDLHGFRGRTLYWGGVAALDLTTRSLRRGQILSAFAEGRYQASWATDAVPLDHGALAVVGRCSRAFPLTQPEWGGQPGGLFLLMDEDLRIRFSASVTGFRPRTVVRQGTRVLVVGDATAGQAATVRPLQDLPRGPTDGFWLVVRTDSQPETEEPHALREPSGGR